MGVKMTTITIEQIDDDSLKIDMRGDIFSFAFTVDLCDKKTIEKMIRNIWNGEGEEEDGIHFHSNGSIIASVVGSKFLLHIGKYGGNIGASSSMSIDAAKVLPQLEKLLAAMNDTESDTVKNPDTEESISLADRLLE